MRQTYSRSEESEKILGIIFDPNITWKNHINYLRQKGFKHLNAIKALSSSKIGTRSDHLLNIINATYRSIFDYGSQLFSFSSNSNRQKLEPIYNAALRLALGLPRNTPLYLLRAESMNETEAIAIWTALKNWVSEAENYIILTDSLLILKSIQNINRKSNTIILNLSSTLHQCLQIAQSITFIWVPAHKGIGINEEVDKLAKASPEP
ncbi:putative RNA-directed DNA polymerase from transposon BS [Trichonephila clavipes]|nr:putative RNA-directed DNA polymerase from transposon BS [Trichonephila clavipes]